MKRTIAAGENTNVRNDILRDDNGALESLGRAANFEGPRHPWLTGVLAGALLLAMAWRAGAQGNPVRPRITARVDDSVLTTLPGNTHPLARAEFDRGAAPTSLQMDHMMLVLKRSPQQEAALEALLAQQQDKTSPNYHQWLTAQQFGQQFGPADQDIQAITSWLQAQGFQDVSVSNGRTTIDFSGTAGSVQSAFHTTMHRYVLANGEEHWANSSDPRIPTALVSVVAGVNSLNNFRRKPLHRARAAVHGSTATVKVPGVKPQFTFGPLAEGCNGANTNCYALGPGDFAKIYSVPSVNGVPTVNGSFGGLGQSIAIVSDSDVFATDVNQFRSIFGLPAYPAGSGHTACPANTPCFDMIETTGTAVGVQFNNNNFDEEEAILDVEWAGATAPGATIHLVVSPSPDNTFTFGGDASAKYVINCQTTGPNCPAGAVPASVLSYSYGECELFLGNTGNMFYNTEWQQAAGEGITVVVATGDNGSAGCDVNESNGFSTGAAEFGLQVNGAASTPFNVSVGGTDFNDFFNPTTYFLNVPGTVISAAGYIPETAYNDTCTNPIIYAALGFANAGLACNSATAQNDGLVATAGGGGGASGCIDPNGPGPSNCTGGYAKPVWQVATGVPADGSRDLPDVSLFAGDGTIQNAYIVCESDLAGQIAGTPPAPCSLSLASVGPSFRPSEKNIWRTGGEFTIALGLLLASLFLSLKRDRRRWCTVMLLILVASGFSIVATACSNGVTLFQNPASSSASTQDFVFEGGTSVSAQAFAGIVALIDQKQGSKQGNINTMLYPLAGGNTFNNIPLGSTNAMPCLVENGVTGCTVTVGTVGELNGYNTNGQAYNQATGLGSVNVTNLLNNF